DADRVAMHDRDENDQRCRGDQCRDEDFLEPIEDAQHDCKPSTLKGVPRHALAPPMCGHRPPGGYVDGPLTRRLRRLVDPRPSRLRGAAGWAVRPILPAGIWPVPRLPSKAPGDMPHSNWS